MNKIYFPKQLLLLAFTVFLFSNLFAQKAAKSEWVYYELKGKLIYKTLPPGDRIMDFSYAGYMGGGVSIPDVKVKIMVNPVDGDNTDAVQNAINEVAKLPLVNGSRGAVLLTPGTYNCERTLNINASGVVLRGSGPGEKGTIINMTGKPHLCISARGNVSSRSGS